MADPRLEQERILPRLQRLLDVVSSWADRPRAARAPNPPDMDAAEAAGTTAGADREVDTDGAHGSAAATGRRHARPTEPIWHLITGHDARVPPGLPASVARALGPGPGEPGDSGDPARAASGILAGSHAPGALAPARVGQSMTTAVGMGHMSGIRAAQSAAGAGVATFGADDVSDKDGASPSAARGAAGTAQDAAVLQPLLGQETPPLFGRATTHGRAVTAGETGSGARPAPASADPTGAGDLAVGHAAGPSADRAAGDGVEG